MDVDNRQERQSNSGSTDIVQPNFGEYDINQQRCAKVSGDNFFKYKVYGFAFSLLGNVILGYFIYTIYRNEGYVFISQKALELQNNNGIHWQRVHNRTSIYLTEEHAGKAILAKIMIAKKKNYFRQAERKCNSQNDVESRGSRNTCKVSARTTNDWVLVYGLAHVCKPGKAEIAFEVNKWEDKSHTLATKSISVEESLVKYVCKATYVFEFFRTNGKISGFLATDIEKNTTLDVFCRFCVFT